MAQTFNTEKSLFTDSTSFLQINKRENNKAYFLKKKIIQSHNYFSSFLKIDPVASGNKKGPKPIFQWISSPGFYFNGQNSMIRTFGMPNEESTAFLTTMSIVLKVKMKKNTGNDQTLVSHSSCGCYALIINVENEVIFKSRCKEDEFLSGYQMPLDYFVTIILTYDGKTTKFYFVSKKKIKYS